MNGGGYFDALLRSAGRAAPVAAQPVGRSDLVEVDVEHEAAPAVAAPRVERAAAVETPTTTPMPVSTVMPTLPPEPRAPSLNAPSLRDPSTWPPMARPDETPSILEPASAVQATSPQQAPATQAPSATSVHKTVRAALAWVATDPQAQPLNETIAIHEAPSPPVDATPTARFEDAEQATEPAQRPTRAQPPSPVALQDHARQPRPPRQPEPDAPREQHMQEETIQVSIGAIHLRVDAPATTAVQPQAPRAPAPPPAPARSSLSRRALYRF